MLHRFQNKVLRIIVDAPRYVPNSVGGGGISEWAQRYKGRIADHPNPLLRRLVDVQAVCLILIKPF
uniref:Uncharacterized protein n=1 Tax=Lutzomyia longipalpis TaxID=7200 RepID=A0A1B0FV27_LUTLO